MFELFADISNYQNVSDYLPILNGCLNADLIVIFLVYHNIFKSTYLKKWYHKYQLSAVIADVLILFIGIIITRYLYKKIFNDFSLFKFTVLAVCVQIIHDYLFYIVFNSLPYGYNKMLDFFKEYAKEVGIGAIIGDSFMVILSCVLSSHFATDNLNTNIILLVLSLYFIPYMINY
jgi:uncharacterized protein YacL